MKTKKLRGPITPPPYGRPSWSPAHCTSCNPSVGATLAVARPLHLLQPIRRGRRPRRPDPNFSAPGRAHGPCPTRRCVIGGGRTESSAPTNRSVGRGALTPPPDLHRTSCKTLSLRTSDRFTAVAIRPPRPRKCFSLHAKKGAPPSGRAPFQTDSIHQKSALPTVRGCSSTSRMLLTPVRYMTIRSKPRPKPACLQVP